MFIRQLNFFAVIVGLLIGLGSVYQVGAAPPEQEKKSSSTPEPTFGKFTTIEGITKTLTISPTGLNQIEPLAVLTSQGFEGAWPASGWNVSDQSGDDGGTYRWGKRNCHPRTGSFGGWAVGGGAQGNNLPCTNDYPNFANSWAIYGPFNLSSATSASLSYYFWGETEFAPNCQFDAFFVGSSANGTNFSGQNYCGDFTNGSAGNGYHQGTLDLSSQLGDNQVWVAFVFVSDNIITFNGITIDDVILSINEDDPPSPPPSNLTALALSQTQILLQWNDNSSNETGFKIEQSLTGAGPWTQIATTPANVTSHALVGLTCGTTYFYRVRAYNSFGNSTYTNTDSGTTLPCTEDPLPPSSLIVTSVSKTQINLSWKDNSFNETGFKIEQSFTGTNPWFEIATTAANVINYASTGLNCQTTYFYRVRALKNFNTSTPSNITNATTSSCTTPVFLPIVLRPPLLPPDGQWTGITSQSQPMSFYISNEGKTLQNFKLKTTYANGGCSGTSELLIGGIKSISNNQFSHNGGTFSFSGQLTSLTTASGVYGFMNHQTGCGLLTQSGTWTAQLP